MIGVTLQAILIAAGLLAIGLLLRVRVRLLRVLYVPAAVVAGAVGFALVQSVTRGVAENTPALASVTKSIAAEWATWPGLLIAVVFAGLLLERPQEGGFADALRRGVRSAVLAWVIILGQLVIGLVVYLLLVRGERPGVPATFAQLLEISWAGGHGSAAGMGTLYAQQGFAEGRDLAFFAATVGLIYGVVSGLFFVNLAIRRKWINGDAATRVATNESASEFDKPIAFAKVRGEVIEPMVLPILFLAAAFAVGLLLQRGFLITAGWVLGADDPATKTQAIDAATNVPLFLFTLLGGWAVRKVADVLRIGHLIDALSIQRLVGVAMEFLIVSGIATLRIESLSHFGWPLFVLLLLAAAWSAFCLLVLARRLLPQAYWFELGLLNYGFSTANTPQGLMLLRMIDPDLRSNAAADYAIAAPLSAPFIGGGIITFLFMPMALQHIDPVYVLLILLIAMAGLLAAGLRLSRSR